MGRKVTVMRDEFLTVRWNNLLSLALGIPTLIYIVAAFVTPSWMGMGGLIGLSLFGVFF